MGSLLDGLKDVGLVSDEQVKSHLKRKDKLDTSRRKQDQSSMTRKSHTPVNFDQLDAATSASAFRRAALELLLEQPDCIDQVIEKAHGLKDAPGGKKLVWQVFQVKKGVKNHVGDELERFLRRGLRKSGGTFSETH
jgi:hypothetical protein